MGGHCAALVVGLALHFALSASPCGLRRATLRAKPTGQKNRDPIGRPRRASSFLGLASEKFFKSSSRKKQKEVQNKKGDISNEVRKGTFLKSFDKWSTSPHEPVDADSVSIRRIDANTVETLQKKDGKVVMTITSTTSKDGKTRTSTWRGKNAEGKDVHNVVVFDRQ